MNLNFCLTLIVPPHFPMLIPKKTYFFLVWLFLSAVLVWGQNQNNKWYFGNKAGLDFMTVPPTPLTGSMMTQEGCASVADAAGNLLFYTDGSTIYDQQHNVMPGGTGLGGNPSTTQSSIIVRQPGSQTIYYVFSLASGNSANLKYSIVNMSLSAGMGSVTSSNNLISTGNSERLTSVKHCNGTDIWVLCAPGSNSVNAYLVTSVGVNTVAVGSSVVNFNNFNNNGLSYIGNMKTSPNGSKIALASYGTGVVYLADFNNATGSVSNGFALGTSLNNSIYGVEFSPDGTKVFGTGGAALYQWDICAGTPTTMVNSINTFTVSGFLWGMQLASDNKIYIARNTQTLAVINNPNVMGVGMNLALNAIILNPTTLGLLNLPNFITSGFLPPVPAFTYSVNNLFGCQTASFTSPAIAQPTLVQGNCSAMGSSVTSVWWNFGDPASGSANTSTLTNPLHAFTTLGTYIVKMVYNYSCGGGSDTVVANVVINQPCISVTSQSITCATLGSATVNATGGVGPYSYTWMPTAQTTSVANGLNPGTYTITVFDQGNGFTYTATTTFVSLVPFTGLLDNTTYLSCYGASTGTASVQLNGGSGNQSYFWISASGTQTTATASGLSAGTHTLLVMDAVTSCSVNQTLFINQAPPLSMGFATNSPSACVGGNITFTGQASGGTPAYTYSWLPGAATNTRTVSHALPGSYLYTLSVTDANTCTITNTLSVDFVANPFLTLSSVSICPLQTGTLTVSGAASYTWVNGITGTTFVDNPLSTTVYSVIGEFAGCTSSISASIVLKALPVPTVSSNSPVCNGQSVNLYASGGTSYLWEGPSGFVSGLQNPLINPGLVNNSGSYNVTVTAANQCTALSSIGFTVNPTPTVTVIGDTVCTTQNALLQSTAAAAVSFNWIGPMSFTSAVQNPVLATPPVLASGWYTLVVTSAQGCSNSAVAALTVTPLPTAFFTSNSPQCLGTNLLFNSSGSSGSNNYYWTGPNGFVSSLPNPVVYNAGLNATGIYTLELSLGPCLASFTGSALVHPLPVPLIQSNSPLCETKTLTLTVNTFTAYQWWGPAGNFATTQSVALSDMLVSQSGLYSVMVTDNNSCQSSTSVSVTVMPNPILNLTHVSVCYGSSAQLTVSGAAAYSWTGPDSFSANTAIINIQPALNVFPVNYTVTGTGLNTCTSVAVASLSTFSLPIAQAQVSPRVCLDAPVYFNGSGGQQYQWNGPLGFNVSNQNFSVLAVNPGMAGTYTLVVTDVRGCRGYTTARFDVEMPPHGYLWRSNAEQCVPFCSSFSLSTTGDAPSVTSWSLNGLPMDGNVFKYCFTNPDDYLISGNFANDFGCRSRQDFFVSARPIPVADFEYHPKEITEGEEVVFESTSKSKNPESWTWYFANNQGYENVTGVITHVYPDAGVYPVALVLKNKWGCADTVVKNLMVDEDFHLFIPNAFTPNQDGLNDEFTITGRGIKSFSMVIFDRWGEKLYETTNANQGWDGTYKGKDCQIGVYAWKIKVASVLGKEKNLTGSITLYR